MRRNPSWSIRVSIAVGCLIGAAGLLGCPCPPTPTEPAPAALSGPIPGPIIDTSGDPGGQLTHRYDETKLTLTPMDPKKLDSRYFAKVSSAMIVDAKCGSSDPKVTYGLAKDVEVTFSFNDGSSYKVKIGDEATPLTWTCSSVGTLTPGNAGEIPDCMKTNMTKKLTSITSSTGKTGDLLIIKTNK